MTAATGKGSISWLLLLIFVSATTPPNDELEKAEMFLGEGQDIDADGIISLEQFEQYMEPLIADIELENWKDSKMDSYLSYDADGDGVVSRQQFSVIYQEGLDSEEYPAELGQEDIDYQDQFRRHWWLKGGMTIQDLQEEGDEQTISIEGGEDGSVHSTQKDVTPQGIEEPSQGTDEL